MSFAALVNVFGNLMSPPPTSAGPTAGAGHGPRRSRLSRPRRTRSGRLLPAFVLCASVLALAPAAAEAQPAKVTGVRVTAGFSELVVRWDAVQGADGYQVQWSESGTFDSDARRGARLVTSGTTHTITQTTVVGRTFDVQPLEEGVEYYIRVRGILTVGDPGDWSDTVGPTTLLAPPAKVTGVMVTEGAAQLTVSWTAVTSADGYKVQWKSGTQRYNGNRQNIISSGTTTTGSITGLGTTAGTEYTVRVIAIRDNVDDGPPSDEVTGTPMAALPGSVAGDRAALMALYNATGGANWMNNSNWGSNMPLDNWTLVDTNDAGRVTTLRFANANNLVGSLPVELGNLTELESLTLSNQPGLTRAIPATLGNLANLRDLFLSNNRLNGGIPAVLGNLSNLRRLSLGGNRMLDGRIPAELGGLTELTALNLSNNMLTGEIPTELGSLTGLTSLNLNNNRLTGRIPLQLRNLTALTSLNLSNNRLTGRIPSALGNLTNLEDLFFSHNDLIGSIPAALGGLSMLEQLSFNGNDLTGSIPPELGNLAALTSLRLDNTRLTGELPSELGDLANTLTRLRLAGNPGLTGCIPATLGGVATNDFGSSGAPALCASPEDRAALVALYDDTNGGSWTTDTNWKDNNMPLVQWHGVTVNAAGQVIRLELANNNLAGTLPAVLGNLADTLTRLELTGNSGLTGCLPYSLRNIDADSHGLSPCQLTAMLVLTPTRVTEGMSTTVTATLEEMVTAAVTLTVSAAAVAPTVAGDFMLTGTTLTIAARQTTSSGTVTIATTANDIDTVDKTVTVSATAMGGSVSAPADRILTITDDDERGVNVPRTVTVTGGSGRYTVRLTSQPTGNVTVTPSTSTTTAMVMPAMLTFTTSNWNTAQTVTVSGVGDDPVTISHTAEGADYDNVMVANVMTSTFLESDINQHNGVNTTDALLVYYGVEFGDILERLTVQRGLLMRNLVHPDRMNDEEYRLMITRAKAWAMESDYDVNDHNGVNTTDTLIIYYAVEFGPILLRLTVQRGLLMSNLVHPDRMNDVEYQRVLRHAQEVFCGRVPCLDR